MGEIINNFHFIRPLWLIMAAPMFLVVLLCFNAQKLPTNWHKVIHPNLINYLLSGTTGKKNNWPLLLLTISWLLSCLALAGPSWNKKTLNAHKDTNPLVVIVDLSPAILAADLSPNRLARVSYKLQDLLRQRQQGSTSIVVYSGSAHAVTPLTDDNNTLINLLKTLSPAIMPKTGDRADLAVDLAIQLLNQAGHADSGDILLLTHDISEIQQEKINNLLKNTNIRLSVIGVGTSAGGPILLADGTYYKDNNKNIKLFKLQQQQLKKLAKANGGNYVDITVDNSDLHKVLLKPKTNSTTAISDRNVDYWQDMGFWIVLFLLPIALFSFRWLYPAILVLFLCPIPDSHAFEWQDLWLTKDQQGKKAFEMGDYDKASTLFENPAWRAESLYTNKQYEAASVAIPNNVTADEEFNRGNALAKAGDFTNSIISYDKALELKPDFDDAAFNKAIVEKLLKEQNEQQKQQQKEKEQKSKQSDKSDKSKQSKSSKQQSQQGDKQEQAEANQQQQGDKQEQAEANQQQQGDKQEQAETNQQQQGDKQEQAETNQQQQGDKQEQAEANQQQQADKQEQAEANQQQQGDKQEQAETNQQSQQAKNSLQKKPNDNNKDQEQQASSGAGDDNDKNKDTNSKASMAANKKQENTPEKQAVESWLRKIPDDPGGLLKRKFMHQFKQQGS